MANEITFAGRKFQWWHILTVLGVGAIFFWPRRAFAAAIPSTTLVGITDRQQWANALYTALTNVFPDLTPRTKALIIAHAALETAYPPYRRDSAANCNNIFNITTGSQWLKDNKPFCVGGDTTYSELTPDGKPKAITQKWRSYPSLEAALLDYWEFLGSRASLKAARDALVRADAPEFARLLREARYYDAPLDQYIAGLKGGVNTAKKYLPFIS
jgi:hypothetical protein